MTIDAHPDVRPPLLDRLRPSEKLPPPERRYALRKAVDATQRDIADEIGVSEAAVSFWERGICGPGPRHYRAYLRLLNGFEAIAGELEAARQPPK